MPSITIRQLDETTKRRLRLRAARAGRSMEDEVRTILRAAAAGETMSSATPAERRGTQGDPESSAESGVSPRSTRPSPVASDGEQRGLLIIGGGVAAYKSLDLIRLLKERGLGVRCILTAAEQKFVTALAAGALSGGQLFTDLFGPTAEFDVGHIRLSREAEVVVVAPATADLMAKMAGGHAD